MMCTIKKQKVATLSDLQLEYIVNTKLIFDPPRPGLLTVTGLIFYPINRLNFYILEIGKSCHLLLFNSTHHGLSLVKILDLYPKMPYFIIFSP